MHTHSYAHTLLRLMYETKHVMWSCIYICNCKHTYVNLHTYTYLSSLRSLSESMKLDTHRNDRNVYTHPLGKSMKLGVFSHSDTNAHTQNPIHKRTPTSISHTHTNRSTSLWYYISFCTTHTSVLYYCVRSRFVCASMKLGIVLFYTHKTA